MNEASMLPPARRASFPVALPAARKRIRVRSVVFLLPAAALLVALPLALQYPVGPRLILAVAAVSLLLTVRSPATTAVCAFVYLAFLAAVRRHLIPFIGWMSLDPLLLVGPVFVSIWFLRSATNRGIPHDTWVSRLVLALALIMGLQVFNPAQGALEIGIGGAIFYLGPLLWFYVGRKISATRAALSLLRALVWVAMLASAYGLYQTYFGFTAAEREWLKLARWTALGVGDGVTRAFSFLSSPAEYAQIVGMAIAVLWAVWLRHRRLSALLPIPLLAIALFLISGRGPVVLTAFAAVVLWSVQGARTAQWAPRGLIALAVAVGGLYWSLTGVQNAGVSGPTENLVRHQTEGLLNPLDEDKSTSRIHAQGLTNGLTFGLTHPLGNGLGATTLAASRFGARGGSTEVDLSDMFVSLGTVGGVLYLMLFVCVLARALKKWHRSRDVISLAALGMLAATVGLWLQGGRYSASMFLWVFVGWLDRPAENGENEFPHETRSGYTSV